MKEEIESAVRAVERAEHDLHTALEQRNQVFAAARASGMTWRSIALASGMTEHGIRKALGYHRNPDPATTQK